MTVQEAVAQVQAALQAAGLEMARREAEMLVAACLGWDRARLIAHPEALLSPTQARRLACWTRRRAQREPLAYLTRQAWFYGLKLTVGRGVLIPRPETELLVELFVCWAGCDAKRIALSSNARVGLSAPCVSHRARILVDAGTGSGAIALACLMHAPQWFGIGIDRSRRALQIAWRNRRLLGLQARLWLLQSDWLSALRPRSVDAVLSNPPYVLPDEWHNLPPEITRHEPREALLVPANDPLRPYRQIALDARRVLRPAGLLAFETSPRLAPLLSASLPEWGFREPQVLHDYSGAARVVWAVA
ncbi:MAG: peptide chain release factor N(5)-glutamine methyltransferase [Fimbriimonadales bacterium]|nr:peptide chain release factor N(5)-glutamine methyltransferase [Fimbriimonadales bacterium]